MNTRHRLLLAVVTAFGLLLSNPAGGQTVTSDVVGFTTKPLLGNSDSFISLPLIRPPAYVGGIQSAAGSTITVSGSPWTANQFVYAAGAQPNHYYALIGPATVPNPKEGHTYPITANTANTITVDLGPDLLTGIPANAQLTIIPNWTLATAFPSTDQDVSFTGTTSTAQYKTQIRVPDVSASGVNLPYITYFFSNNVNSTSNNVGWRLLGDNTTDRGDDALLPDSHFVVRNLNGAPTLPLVSLGTVHMKKFATPLLTSASTQQDNPASLLRPLDVALNATGLKMADGSFAANDQLLLFDNTQAGFDKSPSAIYVQTGATNGPWRLSTDPANDRGNDIIPAGTGVIVRKGVGSGQPAFWVNNAPVQATSAVSRKTHGATGDFDIDLPLSGAPGVECRSTGGAHKVIFTFPAAVTFSGASVTSGTAGTVTPSAMSSNVVAVDLASVTDVQAITVTLLDVSDGTNTNNVAVRMQVLAGDVNGDRTVNVADVAQVKSKSGEAVTATNFRLDVNASGDSINVADIALVKTKSGNTVPAAPGEGGTGKLTAATR